MARFTIYSPTGTALYTGTPSFTGQYMKPGLLEFREVAVPTLLALEPGCYVDYDRTGYRYRIYTVPQIKKQARGATYGGAFVFQGVQLYDASKQLEYCPFRDLVKGDNRIHFSTQPSISTFEGVDGLARRFEACLRDQYDVEGVQSWAVRIATPERDGVDSALYEMMLEPREFTVSGMNILECLEKVYEIWPDVGWVYKVENGIDTIVIGGGGINANSGTYAYGKGSGLTSLTRVAANAEEIANRIFAYGSNQNMLPRWYNSRNIKDAESVDIQNLMLPVGQVGTYPGWGLTDDLPDAAKAFVENAASIAKNGLRPATVYFDGSGEYPAIYPSIRETTIGMVRTAIGDPTAKYYPSTAIYDDADARIDQVLTAPAAFDSGKAGEDGKAAVKTDSESVSDTATGTIQASVPPFQKLYLNPFYSKTVEIDGAGEYTLKLNVPATGTASLTGALGYLGIVVRAYRINNDSTETLVGERETKMDQSSSDATSWTFKTAGLTVSREAVSAGQSVRFEARVVMAKTAQNGGGAYTIALTGNASYSVAFFRAKTFTISIRQVGFDINEQAALGDGKTIAMRSGKCAGRSFAINDVQYDSATDSWMLECWRSEDESLSQWFPNTDYPVEADDEFVLLDIAMPETYIGMAEVKLLRAAEELLADTAVERWQYTPEIDAKYMIENNRVINAGEYLLLSDTDIIGGSAESVLVDTIVINEGEAAIPTYKVTLRDRKKKTWTTSESASASSSKSVGNTREADAAQYIDLSNYVTTEMFESLSSRVATLEAESFFMLDTDGNVTLKAAYQNLWVPGWLAAGGVGSGGGGGGGGSSTLAELLDVSLSGLANGDVLTFNSSTNHWQNTPKDSFLSGYATQSWVQQQGYALSSAIPTESTVAGWGFTKNKGTVTSVTLTSGTGITVSNSGTAITTTGSRTISISSTYQTYISHGNTAYGWGNHKDAGYLTAETDPTVPSWAKAADKPSYSLTEISGTDDLRAIEALTGTSGLLKKTAANTWALDTTTYLASGTTLDNISDGTTRKLANYLPLTGGTLTGAITMSGAGANIVPAPDDVNYLGASDKRFHAGFIRDLYLSYLRFVDGTTREERGTLSMGDGYAQVSLSGTNAANYMFYSVNGFFKQGGGVPLGRSDHRWSIVYSVDGDFSGGISIGGNIVPSADLGSSLGYSTRRFSDLNVRTIGSLLEINFKNQENTAQTGYLTFKNGLMVLRSGVDITSSYKQINFHETNGLYPENGSSINLGYYSSIDNRFRWANIYGVNADLTGDLALAQASHIDIGPLRIEYDATNKALHITKKDSTDTETYGLYADGFVAAGGVQQSA